jgi:hypothetical protein
MELPIKLGTYPMQTEFPCNHCANKLTKFIKKFTYVLLIILHLYIKFQDQNHRNKRAVKKTISDRSNLANLSEISLFWYS